MSERPWSLLGHILALDPEGRAPARAAARA